MYERIHDEDSWCLAYIKSDKEFLDERERLLAEAKEIHRISMSHMALHPDKDERIGAFQMFHELYWSEILILNGLEDELEESYDAVFK